MNHDADILARLPKAAAFGRIGSLAKMTPSLLETTSHMVLQVVSIYSLPKYRLCPRCISHLPICPLTSS